MSSVTVPVKRVARSTPCASILQTIGATPLVRLTGFLSRPDIELFLKIESVNPGGSSKDRPAAAIITAAIREGHVGPGSVVVESSSGNMGIGLAQACRYYGLRFICVVDRRTPSSALGTIKALGAEIEMVEAHPSMDVDLLGLRLDRVRDLMGRIEKAFWPNQYANRHNPQAHEVGTMAEIHRALGPDVNAVFVAVGTMGTLKGCLDFVRVRRRRSTRIVAVDAEGSVLFGGRPAARHISGMGAARVPPLAVGVKPSEVIRVTDLDCVVGCRRLAVTDAILVGGSSGGVLQAIRSREHALPPGICVAIAADGGHRYLDTVYDDDWVAATLGCSPERLADLVGPLPATRL